MEPLDPLEPQDRLDPLEEVLVVSLDPNKALSSASLHKYVVEISVADPDPAFLGSGSSKKRIRILSPQTDPCNSIFFVI